MRLKKSDAEGNFVSSYDENDLLTVEEVAAALTVSPRTIRKWRYQGDLAAVKIGKRLVRFRWGEVLRCIAAEGD